MKTKQQWPQDISPKWPDTTIGNGGMCHNAGSGAGISRCPGHGTKWPVGEI